MFDPTSRYFALETSSISVKDRNGKEHKMAYKLRRFLPALENMTAMVEHTVKQGERLDNMTARYLGDPLQFWRLCDANNVFRPDELEMTGRQIKISLPNL